MSQPRDPYLKAASLTKWVTWLVYLLVFVTACSIFSELLSYFLLHNFVGEFNKEARIQLSHQEVWQNIVVFANFIINLVAGILILMWIYRANANAQLLGAQDMKFTPGWSVGWFFIPIAMLFKPFQAMKEIWRASANPQDWQNQPVSALVGLWWFFWIFDNLLANISLRMSMHAAELDNKMATDIAMIIADLGNIPLCFVLVALVNNIYQMQLNHIASAPPLSLQKT